MLAYIIFAICVGIVLYMYVRRKANKDSSLMLPPGPKGYPVLGNMLDIDLATLYLKLGEWARVYGEIYSFRLMGQHVLVLNSSDIIREAMTTKPYDEIFADRPLTFCGKYLFFDYQDIGTGMYNAGWLARRKVAHRLIKLQGKGGEEIERWVVKELQMAVDCIRETGGEPFYPKDIVMSGLTDIIGRLVM
jgi:hypothetical protein